MQGAMLGLWAQATTAAPGTDPQAIARIALRRWFSGLTLSGPEVFTGQMPWFALAGGLAGLLLLALVIQGPGRALAQLFDIPGHFRLISAALGRFRAASRLVVLLLLVAVTSWTVWESRQYSNPQRLEELALLLKNKGVYQLATEQGLLAALTPLRDVAGLGDTLILMIAVSVLVFRVSAERWEEDTVDDASWVPAWTTPAWVAAWLYVLYRVTILIVSPDGYPASASTYLEPVLIPTLMLICDGLLLAWVLGELRRSELDELAGSRVAMAVRWLPAAVLACLVALPARVVAVTAFLILNYALRYVSVGAPSVVLGGLIWLLMGWGLTVFQAGSLMVLPLVGAAAYGPIRGGTWSVWWRMMRHEGGRLVAMVAFCGVGIGIAVALVYALLFQYPVQSWLLAAADSYSHYVTIPLGLILLATLVEIADRVSLPGGELESPVEQGPLAEVTPLHAVDATANGD